MTEPEIKVVSVPVLDTGLGREAGYRDDAELIAVAKAERAALSPEVREVVERIDEKLDRAFLFGD